MQRPPRVPPHSSSVFPTRTTPIPPTPSGSPLVPCAPQSVPWSSHSDPILFPQPTFPQPLNISVFKVRPRHAPPSPSHLLKGFCASQLSHAPCSLFSNRRNRQRPPPRSEKSLIPAFQALSSIRPHFSSATLPPRTVEPDRQPSAVVPPHLKPPPLVTPKCLRSPHYFVAPFSAFFSPSLTRFPVSQRSPRFVRPPQKKGSLFLAPQSLVLPSPTFLLFFPIRTVHRFTE